VRVAWFTPLPPMPSGIADYSSEIVPFIAERSEIDVFCPRPGLFRRPRVPRGASLHDPKDYLRLIDRYDAAFYHLGNGNLAGAESMSRRALKRFERYPDRYFGFDLAAQRGSLRLLLEGIARGDVEASSAGPPRWTFDRLD